ncbi:RDD family protein [Actinomadura sp. KC06]|uniref:RDD family protein n=1 Tax=Actinomadura sp. KC06 TaxID=2530369 RepID=UPI0010470E09|nr:RDD family protein [Actinomadura sp. KC06]TDD37568.1 RDD family protein [Actinomadura sp. KC06]
MTDEQRIIDDYAREYEGLLAGSPDERARGGREMAGYLQDAAEAGELAETLRRLGSPRAAVTAMSKQGSAPTAPLGARFDAALRDHAPLLVVTVVLMLQQVLRQLDEGGPLMIFFPPPPYQPGGGLLHAILMTLALTWSIVALGVIEGRTGTTPGKRRAGLRVVDDTGVRAGTSRCVLRRLSLLGGPLVWLDWAGVLGDGRRRFSDRLTRTKVITLTEER